MKYKNSYNKAVAWVLILVTFHTGISFAKSISSTIGNRSLSPISAYLSSNVLENKDCLPVIEVAHVKVFSKEFAAKEQLPTPFIGSKCGTIVQTEYTDQYFDLGCSINNFTGYFDPARWTTAKISGDGGVDVTGAPAPRLLVEGTNNQMIEVANGLQNDFNLIMPADGYLSLKWVKEGSSTTTTGSDFSYFKVLINNQTIYEGNSAQEALQPYFIKSGDRLTFELSSDHQADILIQDFNFLTNTSAVIERLWSAKDNWGNEGHSKQLISIEKNQLYDINFPSNIDVQSEDLSYKPEEIDPSEMGFPYFNVAANNGKDNYQISLEPGAAGFDVYWEDELNINPEEITISRNWKIADMCNQNRLEKTQTIKISYLENDYVRPFKVTPNQRGNKRYMPNNR